MKPRVNTEMCIHQWAINPHAQTHTYISTSVHLLTWSSPGAHASADQLSFPSFSCFCCSFSLSWNLCSQLKLSSGNSISPLMLSQKHTLSHTYTHTHTHTHTHTRRKRESWRERPEKHTHTHIHTHTHTHTHTHLTHALTCPLSVCFFLTHCQQTEVIRKRRSSKGNEKQTYQTWDVNAAQSGG